MLVIDNSLVFAIPEVHPDVDLCLNFQRTFRIPETETYNLPPGMGKYPIHILGSNELLIPMYQSDALWINVQRSSYPFAIKATCQLPLPKGRGLSLPPKKEYERHGYPWLTIYEEKAP